MNSQSTSSSAPAHPLPATATHLPAPLRGIVPPMITPLRARDELDLPGLERLIEHILGGGVHGLFILGTSGEAPSLSYRLRRELIDRVCRQVAGRIPVLVGITDSAFVEAVTLARYAADAGATALVTSTPFYFPPAQPELEQYLERLVPALPLPIFLYNMPAMTKVPFGLETLRQAVQLPGIVGLKDSSGDLTYFKAALELLRERPDWTILVGPEHLLADTLKLGGHGGVNGGANFLPRLFVDLYEAVRRGDTTREAELQRRLLVLGQVYQVGHYASAVVKGMKCALSLLGICDDFMAEPFSRFREPEREQVRGVLRKSGLLN